MLREHAPGTIYFSQSTVAKPYSKRLTPDTCSAATACCTIGREIHGKYHRNARHAINDNKYRTMKNRQLNYCTLRRVQVIDQTRSSIFSRSRAWARLCLLFRQTRRNVTCRSRQGCMSINTKISADGDNCYVNKRIKHKNIYRPTIWEGGWGG